ncbi:MAG: T9SS type A sorting domain-containing protein [Bacteroidota bacterium]
MKWQLIFALTFVCLAGLSAQDAVFPGDANANGVVDQYDVPYIGFALGSTGPARILTEDQTSSQSIPVLWSNSFPEGPNYIHADADGNGLVDVFDFFVWNNNFGIEHDEVQPLFIPDDASAASSVVWNNNLSLAPLTALQSVNVPFVFDIPVQQSINGMAYRIRYHPEHFAEVRFRGEDNWLITDGNGISLQENSPGQIDVGVTRLGPSPSNGGGTGGVLELVIIDDMIGLMEMAPDTMSTYIFIEELMLLDGELGKVPVTVDSFEVKLYRPGTISQTLDLQENPLQAKVFPNPFQGQLQVQTAEEFHRLLIIDPLGRIVETYQFSPRRSWKSAELALASGCYFLQLEGENGISRLRLIAP